MAYVKKFKADKATADAKAAAIIAYENILNNIKKGIDKDATGSDRLNELKCLQFGTSLLPDIIKNIAELDRMIAENDFLKKDGESDWSSEAENHID